jgi:hypothetical protein
MATARSHYHGLEAGIATGAANLIEIPISAS